MLVRHIVGGCVAENACMSERSKGRIIFLWYTGMIKNYIKSFPFGKILNG